MPSLSLSRICRDDPTTWLLVSTRPSGEITMTEPSPPRARGANLGAGFDPHHGGADAFGHADHGVGIGVEQRLIVGGGAFVCFRWQPVIGDISGKIQHGQNPLAFSNGSR